MVDVGDAFGDRLEDVFQDEICRRINTITDFAAFARSRNGLELSENDICEIQDNDKDNVGEQKMKMLFKWQELQGSDASPVLIRDILENYLMKYGDEMKGEDGIYANTRITKSNEIPKAGKSMGVGDCAFSFAKACFSEPTKVCLSHELDKTPPPDGYFPATSSVRCHPWMKARNKIVVGIHTWCSTDASVDATIFEIQRDGSWKEVDMPIVPTCDSEDTHLEYSSRELSCVKGFISEDHLNKIKFSISCFVYSDPNGKFAMAFCLRDVPMEKFMDGRLSKDGFFPVIAKMDPIKASIGDVITFYIEPGQRMKNTKFTVDQKFVSSTEGHVVCCDLDKKAEDPKFIIRVNHGNIVVYEKQYAIEGMDCGKKGRKGYGISIMGDIEADNFIGEAGDVDIDQRKFETDTNGRGSRPFWEKNDLSYQENEGMKMKKNVEAKGGKIAGFPNLSITGNIKARTVIGKAGTVRIDQRKIKTKDAPPPGGPGAPKIVAEQRAVQVSGEPTRVEPQEARTDRVFSQQQSGGCDRADAMAFTDEEGTGHTDATVTQQSAGCDVADAMGFVDEEGTGHTDATVTRQSAGCDVADAMGFMEEEGIPIVQGKEYRKVVENPNDVMEYNIGQRVEHSGDGY